ncbi:uncharacterized protein N7459_000937 [Penicillium hispanicum]|uniref:uncharacterized protein n=1 Tax=Penicillium hispanicum TaxID=1080232 RepID=UPI0025406506|nr:uncharacterized protein N7459_000937 [Penicillium hispanicum]KAJ5594729.1 hypothetical protein N7459_000937 [Penicillium hispanicum]
MRRKLQKDTWREERLLGSGSFGTVSLHKCLTSEGPAQLQAVKSINKAIADEGIDYYKELEAIAKFSQTKYAGLFVEFLGWYENDTSVFIAMEFMEHGDLESHLTKPLPESEARCITLQIAEGLEALHENGVADQEENIFVFRKSPSWWVKIGDFGFTKHTTGPNLLQTFVGTPMFLAPEMQFFFPEDSEDSFLAYTEKIDIWALGVIVFYMVFNEYPLLKFPPNKYPMEGDLPFPKAPLSPLSDDCYAFIKATLAPYQSERLSAKAATQTSWLRYAETSATKNERISLAATRPGDVLVLHGTKGKPKPQEPGNRNQTKGRIFGLYWNTWEGTEDARTSSKAPGNSGFWTGLLPSEDARKPYLDKLFAIHTQGVAFYKEGDLEKAEPLLRQAAEGRKQVLGLMNADTRNSLHCLGVLYYHLSKFSEAKGLFYQVHGAQQEVYGPRHQSTLRSRYWLGVLLICEGQCEGGQIILREVFNNQKEVLGPENPETLETLSEIKKRELSNMKEETRSMQKRIMGHLEELKGKRKKFALHGKAVIVQLPLNESHFQAQPPEDDSLASITKSYYLTMARLGEISYRLERYKKAQPLLEGATNGLKKALGPKDIHSLKTAQLLGLTHFNVCQYETAGKILQDVADRRTEILGKHHLDTVESCSWLGKALSAQAKYHDAEKPFLQVLGAEETLGISHPKIRSCLECYGHILEKQDKPREAENVWGKLVEANTMALGHGHSNTLRARRQLACSLEAQGDVTEAYMLFQAIRYLTTQDPRSSRESLNESEKDVQRTKQGDSNRIHRFFV